MQFFSPSWTNENNAGNTRACSPIVSYLVKIFPGEEGLVAGVRLQQGGRCWPPRSSARLCCCSSPLTCCWWRGGCGGISPSGCWLGWGSTAGWQQTERTGGESLFTDLLIFFTTKWSLMRRNTTVRATIAMLMILTALEKDIPASPISFFVLLSGF